MQTQNLGNKSHVLFNLGSSVKKGGWILQYPEHLYFRWGLSITTGTVTGDFFKCKATEWSLQITGIKSLPLEDVYHISTWG